MRLFPLFAVLRYVTLISSAEKRAVIWWELKPYAFVENKTAKGVIIEMMEKYRFYCEKFIKHKVDFFIDGNNFGSNYSGLLKLAESNFTQIHAPVKNISETAILILPLLKPNLKLSENNFYAKTWFNAPGVFVIVNRDDISAYKKMFQGLLKTIPLLLLGLLSASSVGTVVWLLEKRFNPDFKRRFPLGVLDGLWWAMITMTTVGYGDMVPKSSLSRLISFAWVLIGLIFSSVLTATVTNTLTSEDFIEISGKKVAVLMQSGEEQIARQYGAIPQEQKNYQDVLTALRNGDVYAALINSHVASWMQDEIRDGDKDVKLSIVYEIKKEIPIWNVEYNSQKSDNSTCILSHQQEIITETILSYYKHTQLDVTYSPSVEETFLPKNGLGIFFVLVTFVLICVAGAEEMARKLYGRHRKKKEKSNMDEHKLEITKKENSNFRVHVNHELLKMNKNFQELKIILEGLERSIQKN